MEIPDLISQKVKQTVSSFQKNEDNIYRLALEKRFGNCDDETVRKCSLIVNDGGLRVLMYGNEALCEIHPPKPDSFLGSSAQNIVNYTQHYRIF